MSTTSTSSMRAVRIKILRVDVETECNACDGEGVVAKSESGADMRCEDCEGRGYHKKTVTLATLKRALETI